MGRRRKYRDLYAFINGRLVGTLRATAGRELVFQYAESWLDYSKTTPLSLSLPLSRSPHSGPIVEAYFDNLLPDNVEVRRRIGQRFRTDTAQPFDLLSAVGRDCVGAVQLLNAPDPPDIKQITKRHMNDARIAQTLRELSSSPLGMHQELDDFRISIAGAQEKTGYLRHRGRWYLPTGATPTTHIFKPPLQHDTLRLEHSVENEWLCLRLCAALGLSVAEAQMLRFEDQQVLSVTRFDRTPSADRSWILRLPQEDLCQAHGLPPALRYEVDGGPGIQDVMQLLLGSVDPLEDRREFLRACIVFWLLAAIDGHAKNFSLSLLPGSRYRLAPLYDIISVHPLLARGDLHPRKTSMAMAVLGKNRHYQISKITGRHWLSTAKRCHVSKQTATELLAELKDRTEDAIEQVTDQLPQDFPAHTADSIFAGLRTQSLRLTNTSALVSSSPLPG